MFVRRRSARSQRRTMRLIGSKHPGIAFNKHFDVEGSVVFHHADRIQSQLSSATTGPKPADWSGFITREAGRDTWTYLLRFGSRDIWKIGLTQDIARRLAEVNQHVPHEETGERWEGVLTMRWSTAKGEKERPAIPFRFAYSPPFSVLTLGAGRCGRSRQAYVEFRDDERVETLIGCHETAFPSFEGVLIEVLYDNMKTVVIERNTYGLGVHRFHAGFFDYAPLRSRAHGAWQREDTLGPVGSTLTTVSALENVERQGGCSCRNRVRRKLRLE